MSSNKKTIMHQQLESILRSFSSKQILFLFLVSLWIATIAFTVMTVEQLHTQSNIRGVRDAQIRMETKMDILFPPSPTEPRIEPQVELQSFNFNKMVDRFAETPYFSRLQAVRVVLLMYKYCQLYKVSINEVEALLVAESSRNPNATGSIGEAGLMQVRLCHFTEDENPYCIETNLRKGIQLYTEAYSRVHHLRTNSDVKFVKAVYIYNGSNPNKPYQVSIVHGDNALKILKSIRKAEII